MAEFPKKAKAAEVIKSVNLCNMEDINIYIIKICSGSNSNKNTPGEVQE